MSEDPKGCPACGSMYAIKFTRRNRRTGALTVHLRCSDCKQLYGHQDMLRKQRDNPSKK